MRGLIVLATVLAFPALALAEVSTAGFVQGLWHDKPSIFADEPVRLYVAIRNNTGSDLTGKVEFKDNGKTIGSSNVSALNNRLIESWVDWTPSYGEHTITATLSRVELSAIGTTTRRVEVVESTTKELFFVDYDTDEDGIGNKDDKDDDNDGISDEADATPLVYTKRDDGAASASASDGVEDTDKEPARERTSEHIGDGLERYLTDNRADTILTSVTNTVTKAKERLDAYRATRAVPSEPDAPTEQSASSSPELIIASTQSVATDDAPQSSFGEVTRTQGEQVSFLGKLFTFVKNLLNAVYTFLLYLLSLYLGHPAVVQLTLLVLIVFIIFKVAKRLSSRPV